MALSDPLISLGYPRHATQLRMCHSERSEESLRGAPCLMPTTHLPFVILSAAKNLRTRHGGDKTRLRFAEVSLVPDANPKGPSPRCILFSTTGCYGHFHPLVPLARALKEAGHEVAFAASAHLQSPVEAHDFAFFQVGGNLSIDPEWHQFKAQQ